MYHYTMLTIASCSASGLRVVFLGLVLHIYIAQTEHKGIYCHICIYTGHICIYGAWKIYI